MGFIIILMHKNRQFDRKKLFEKKNHQHPSFSLNQMVNLTVRHTFSHYQKNHPMHIQHDQCASSYEQRELESGCKIESIAKCHGHEESAKDVDL